MKSQSWRVLDAVDCGLFWGFRLIVMGRILAVFEHELPGKPVMGLGTLEASWVAPGPGGFESRSGLCCWS